ncbi:MAG: PhzF family phenazine biosynthesis protein, partial [Acidiferrobacterales bacterium]
FGGNQLAVFPDAHGLGPAQMQAVAREFNISETVFVFPPKDSANTRRLRIFTPAAELPFAGHPTVGTAVVLAASGELALDANPANIVFEEGAGPVDVAIKLVDGKPVTAKLTAPRLPEFGPPPPSSSELAAMLSLAESDLLGVDNVPQAVSCGTQFLFVPLRDRQAVARARVKRELWEPLLSSYWAPSIFVFSYDGELQGSDLHARMFAPNLGVDEDPATGSAVAALGGYLGVRDKTNKDHARWVIEQGFEMKRPSKLEVFKQDGEITKIQVGGAAVLVSEGSMEIPAVSEIG